MYVVKDRWERPVLLFKVTNTYSYAWKIQLTFTPSHPTQLFASSSAINHNKMLIAIDILLLFAASLHLYNFNRIYRVNRIYHIRIHGKLPSLQAK